MEQTVSIIILLFSFTLLLSFLTNYLLLKISFSISNQFSQVPPNQERWASFKPAVGGISFFIVFLASLSLASLVPLNQREGSTIKMLGIIASCVLGFILGLSDDAYNTNPLAKFIVQLCCGFILISSGVYIHLTPSESINFTLSIIWVIGLMNSVNMLDNMDGITSSISGITILGMMITLAQNPNQEMQNIIIMSGVTGGIVGFLIFNWYPAKMFMGDTGSQFLGVFLAAFSMETIWNFKPENTFTLSSQLGQFIIPALYFFIPLTDTTTVTFRRLFKKSSPFIGGKDHITHHFVYAGLNEQQTVLTLSLIQIITVVIGILFLFEYIDWSFLNATICVIFLMSVFVLLQVIYAQGDKRKMASLK